VVTGRIVDSETGNPLENAIVFLANTPVGSSSGKDGTFRILYIPIGQFELVVSCIGYKRQSISLNIVKPESLYYEIRLQAQPIPTGGVEILGKRPEGLKPDQYTFFPKESPNTYCIYGAGSSMPVGIFFADSAFYMYALDTAIVDSEKYIRLWLLYLNLSQRPYDFDPMKCAKLHMSGKKSTYKDVSPDAPERILTVVRKQDAMDSISKTIAPQLKKLATLQTEFQWEEWWTGTLGESGMHPRPFARKPFIFAPSSKGTLSSGLYEILTNSLNDGILKRYSVFPENSVNGYIYFPFPGLNWKVTASGFPEATEYVYTVEVITQNGSKYIEFEPH